MIGIIILVILIIGVCSLFFAVLMYALANSTTNQDDKTVIIKKAKIAFYISLLILDSIALLYFMMISMPTS